MEAKEKAKELIEKYYLCMPFKDVKLTSCNESPELILKMEKLSAKQCASIAVDEIINACEYNHVESWNTDWWEEVKKEITNY